MTATNITKDTRTFEIPTQKLLAFEHTENALEAVKQIDCTPWFADQLSVLLAAMRVGHWDEPG